MIRLIIFIVVSAILAYVAVWLADSPGSVTLSWGEQTVMLRMDVAVAAIAAIAIAAVLIYEAWRWLIGLPRRIAEHRQHNREVRGYQELASGLMAAAAGDVAGAKAHTRHAEKLLDSNPATLLLSAQTAQLEGKEDVAQIKFRQMLKQPETEFLGLRGLLADAVKRGDQETALQLARKARQRSPNTPWVLTTYFDLLTRNEEWQEAYAVIGDLARQKLLSRSEATRRRALINHMMAEQALREDRLDDALAYAKKATQLAPGFSPAAVTGATTALRAHKSRLARKFIEKCWRLQPHPDLAHAYAQLNDNETALERLDRFQRLYYLQPNDATTHMVLAGLAMAARHWDTAKKHLDQAMQLDPTAGVFRLYAEYERNSGGGEARAREWLAKAVDARPDKAWVCEDTGEILPRWQLFGVAGRFDSVHWDYPPKVAYLSTDQRPSYALPHEPAAPTGVAGVRNLPARTAQAAGETEGGAAASAGKGSAENLKSGGSGNGKSARNGEETKAATKEARVAG